MPCATSTSRTHLRWCCRLVLVAFLGLSGSTLALAAAFASAPRQATLTVAATPANLAAGEAAAANLEVRIGTLVGQCRKDAQGGLEFTLKLAGAAWKKGERQFQVRVDPACALTWLRSGENGDESEVLTIDRALSLLNGGSAIVSIEGNFERATQTFVARTSLTIVE